MKLTTVVLFMVAMAAIKGEDECALKPGERFIEADQCCMTDDIFPESFWDAEKTCMDKLHLKVPGPIAVAKPGPLIVKAFACKVECMFSENKLLTADNKVDKEAVTELTTASIPDEMKSVVIAGIDKCIEIEVDPSLECTSGAIEFRQCLSREVFLNCPTSYWTSNTKCDDWKTKITKCPMTPIILGKKRPKKD